MADSSKTLAALEQAVSEKLLTESALENIRLWLTAPQYVKYVPTIEKLVADGEWKALDDAFWTVIPFGTGGRRGRMFPVGTNAINDVTIGESAQGLATYVLDFLNPPAPAIGPPAPSRTIHGTVPAILPNSAPGSWSPTGSKSGSSTATAARRK